MRFIKYHWIIILIIFIGAAARFYQLGTNPGPLVAIFGLSDFSVKFLSALIGVCSIIVIYLVVLELFQNESIGLSISFMSAISPLGIYFARAGFESNLTVFLNILGLWLFLEGIKNNKFFYASFLTFGLSLFTFQGAGLVVPIILLGLCIFYKKELVFNKDLMIPTAIFLIFLSMVIYTSIFLGQFDRLSGINFFNYHRSTEEVNQILKEDNLTQSSFSFEVLHGEWFAYMRGSVDRYTAYFSPRILFIDGDSNPTHGVPDFGFLYYMSVIFLPLGFWFLIRNFYNRPTLGIVLLWLIMAPLPAIFSKELININESLNLLFPLTLLEGLGLYNVILLIRKMGKFSSIGYFVLIIVILFNIAIFIDRYTIHFPKEYSQRLQNMKL